MMFFSHKKLPVFFLFVAATGIFLYAADPVVSIIVKDEGGAPVEGATVTAGWSLPREPGTGWGAGPGAHSSGITNASGISSVRVGGWANITAEKDLYYENGYAAASPELFGIFTSPMNKLIPPSPPIEIILIKKSKPSPMYVRGIIGKEVPKAGEYLGFDLLAGDWIAPYGGGSVADFELKMIWEYKDYHDFEHVANVRWPGDGNGVIPCYVSYRLQGIRELRLPKTAPMQGYISAWSTGLCHPRRTSTLAFAPNDLFPDEKVVFPAPKGSESGDLNFIFRTRGRKNASGENAGALYGKIHGRFGTLINERSELPAGEKRKAFITFYYYINPTGENVLEWDTINNLAKDQSVPNEP